jgi:hypothetical protein
VTERRQPGAANDSGQRRRGSDLVVVQEFTAWQLLRRYISIGGWVGNCLFLLYGAYLGLSFGALGGLQFFSDMIAFDATGSFAKGFGILVGIVVGLICVWAIFVVIAAFCGVLVYWFKFRSLPSPEK